MSAIYKRELRAYFVTPIGYVCLAIFLAASGFLFSMTTLLSQTTDTSTYFVFSLFLLIIVCSLLTMRLFSEEKKLRTEQLLMTAPISITSMVTAKFFAAETVFLAGLLLTSLNVIPLYLYAEPYTAQIVGNYRYVYTQKIDFQVYQKLWNTKIKSILMQNGGKNA